MDTKKKIAVVVLGDIGHSPRMQYHCSSLYQEGYNVNVIGYTESNVCEHIQDKVKLINLPQPPPFKRYTPVICSYIFKTIWQAVTLFWSLLWNGNFQTVLVQNPPAIPSLAVCWFYCFILRKKFIIDWHNYAYTILALSLTENHVLVRFSRVVERYFGQLAHHNICVSNAMKEDLAKNWNIRATTLYDRPGPQFTAHVPLETKLNLFHKLSENDPEFRKLTYADNRPKLLITSTSWTEDEDFWLLLNTLREYEASNDVLCRPMICVITGKGPMKDYFFEKVSESDVPWRKVHIVSVWLEPQDYPILLASADLGVCLHKSSSGFDLPMKIIDMFGAGLPVCAYKYPCLSELVQHNKNGLTFENSHQLYSYLTSWFGDYSKHEEQCAQFKQEMKKFTDLDWHTSWKKNVSYMFL